MKEIIAPVQALLGKVSMNADAMAAQMAHVCSRGRLQEFLDVSVQKGFLLVHDGRYALKRFKQSELKGLELNTSCIFPGWPTLASPEEP